MTEKQLEKFNNPKNKRGDNAPLVSLPANKKHLSLVGFMGAGKTTICNALGQQALDLDFLVEKRAMLKIYDIFRNFGQAKFREMELALLKEIAKKPKPICLATGGGVITTTASRTELIKSYCNIFLYLPPEIACERVENDKKRPLFSQDVNKMKELFNSRLDWYLEVADLILDMEKISTETAVKFIKDILGRL